MIICNKHNSCGPWSRTSYSAIPGFQTAVELPLLSGSLSVPVVVELQGEGDGQLEQGHGPQEFVAVPDCLVVLAHPHHAELGEDSIFAKEHQAHNPGIYT